MNVASTQRGLFSMWIWTSSHLDSQQICKHHTILDTTFTNMNVLYCYNYPNLLLAALRMKSAFESKEYSERSLHCYLWIQRHKFQGWNTDSSKRVLPWEVKQSDKTSTLDKPLTTKENKSAIRRTNRIMKWRKKWSQKGTQTWMLSITRKQDMLYLIHIHALLLKPLKQNLCCIGQMKPY